MRAKRHNGVLGRSGGATPGTTRTNGALGSWDASGRLGDDAATHISGQVTLDLPMDVLEAVAQRAAEMVAHGIGGAPEPWVGVEDAAEHLCCPKSRVYRLVSRAQGGKQTNPLPFERDGSRLLFHRSALDEWVARGGAQG